MATSRNGGGKSVATIILALTTLGLLCWSPGGKSTRIQRAAVQVHSSRPTEEEATIVSSSSTRQRRFLESKNLPTPTIVDNYCDETKLGDVSLPRIDWNDERSLLCNTSVVHVPALHDDRPDVRQHFRSVMARHVQVRNSDPHDVPHVHRFDATHNNNGPAYFVIWSGGKTPRASAWGSNHNNNNNNNQHQTHYVVGDGWEAPPPVIATKHDTRVLRGSNVVGFTSWFEGRFGHYADDHLPTIALLKHLSPDDTKFLLLDTPLSRNVLGFLDPAFAQRVVWIQEGQVIQIEEGSLTVAIPHQIPLMWGCCRPYEFLRHWVAKQRHQDVPVLKTKVVYCSRRAPSAKHGRRLHPDTEKAVLREIRLLMNRLLPGKELVIFDGVDPRTNQTWAIAEQSRLFRSAHTIIGPHGAGILGNLLWVDPMPQTCRNRVKLLEFIPGPDSASVQAQYQSVFQRWRHWPIEFHNILYTSESTKELTHVRIGDLRMGLEAMWHPNRNRVESTAATIRGSHYSLQS